MPDPVDPTNHLLAPLPSHLVTGKGRAADGTEIMFVTIRTPDVTLTVHLAQQDGLAWGEALTAEARGMSGLVAGKGNGANGRGIHDGRGDADGGGLRMP